jgi:hypothetical protein
MLAGHLITRGFVGSTMITRGLGQNNFTAQIKREVLRLISFVRRTLELESHLK